MSTTRIFEMIMLDKKSLIKIASGSASLMNTVTSIINNNCANLTVTTSPCDNATTLVSKELSCPYGKPTNITVSACGNENDITQEELDCIQYGFASYDPTRDYGCMYNWLPYILSLGSGFVSLVFFGTVIMLKNREDGNVLCKPDKEELTEETLLMYKGLGLN